MDKPDWTPLHHAGLAILALVAIGFVLWPLIGIPLAAAIGGTFGVAFYVGREVAQAETRKPDAHGGAWWRGFDARLWNVGSVLDLAVPALTCGVIILACWIVGEHAS